MIRAPAPAATLRLARAHARQLGLSIWKWEYVRRDSSRGGHDFHRFIDPEDLARMLRRHRARITHMSGIRWSPRLEFPRSTRVSYLGLARLAG